MPANSPRVKSGFQDRIGPQFVAAGELTQEEFQALVVLGRSLKRDEFNQMVNAIRWAHRRERRASVWVTGLSSLVVHVVHGSQGLKFKLAAIDPTLPQRIEDVIRSAVKPDELESRVTTSEAEEEDSAAPTPPDDEPAAEPAENDGGHQEWQDGPPKPNITDAQLADELMRGMTNTYLRGVYALSTSRIARMRRELAQRQAQTG